VIPPINNVNFAAAGALRVTIEAGSRDRTIQLIFVPVAPGQAASPGRFQRVVWAFDLKLYEARGQELRSTLRRPWVIQVSLDQIDANLGDPRQLLFALYEEGRWVPQVTNYFPNDRSLVFRMLHPGRFAILAEARPT